MRRCQLPPAPLAPLRILTLTLRRGGPRGVSGIRPGRQSGSDGGESRADGGESRADDGERPPDGHRPGRPPARSGSRRGSRASAATSIVGSLADGAIYRIDAATREGSIFVPGVEGAVAVGIEADEPNGRIWVAGGPTGEVRAYAADSGDLLGTYTFEGEIPQRPGLHGRRRLRH